MVPLWTRLAEKVLDILAVALFAAMFGAIILQIVLRYVFNAPLVWTDEFASYLFVWISFLGWTMAARKRIHIGIGIVADRLPARGRRLLHGFWCAATIAFALVLLVVGVIITRRNADVQMVSLDHAIWPVYAVVPIAALFLVLYGVRDLVTIIRKGDIKATEVQL
jgi:TRAP-type C4-dicarboxylate transport system permease small subunit